MELKMKITTNVLKVVDSGGQTDVTVEVKLDGKVIATPIIRISISGKEAEAVAVAQALRDHTPAKGKTEEKE